MLCFLDSGLSSPPPRLRISLGLEARVYQIHKSSTLQARAMLGHVTRQSTILIAYTKSILKATRKNQALVLRLYKAGRDISFTLWPCCTSATHLCFQIIFSKNAGTDNGVVVYSSRTICPCMNICSHIEQQRQNFIVPIRSCLMQRCAPSPILRISLCSFSQQDLNYNSKPILSCKMPGSCAGKVDYIVLGV